MQSSSLNPGHKKLCADTFMERFVNTTLIKSRSAVNGLQIMYLIVSNTYVSYYFSRFNRGEQNWNKRLE